MSHIGHPLVGDTLYGGREEGITRQALHCRRIRLLHTLTGEPLIFEAPLPEDMKRLIEGQSINSIT
jgi:23S rRNA pseudouridine1911/1915/1917 synthase